MAFSINSFMDVLVTDWIGG